MRPTSRSSAGSASADGRVSGGSPAPRSTLVGIDDTDPFEEYARDALDSLPAELARSLSNVAVVVAEEPPPGLPLLGLYEGVPLTRRTSGYAAVPPDRITIFRGPLLRLYGHDEERLRAEVRRVVLHEIAHHFGISDERLVELGRY